MNTVTNLLKISDDLTANGVTPKVTMLPSAINKKRRTRKTQRKTKPVVNTNVNYDSVTPKRDIAATRANYAAQVKADRKAEALERRRQSNI